MAGPNIQGLVEQLEYNQQIVVFHYVRDMLITNINNRLNSLSERDLLEVHNIVRRMNRPPPLPMTGNNTETNTENNSDAELDPIPDPNV